MSMTGAIVNALAIVAGGAVGLLFQRGIPERVSKTVMIGLGLCVLYIGISGAFACQSILIVIVAMTLGAAAGALLNIDGAIHRLGTWVEAHVHRHEGGPSLAEGFVTASLLCCVGAMAVNGSLNAGIRGDNSILLTKSMIDLVFCAMLATTLGAGVMLAGAAVFVVEGALTLLAGAIAPLRLFPRKVLEGNVAGRPARTGLRSEGPGARPERDGEGRGRQRPRGRAFRRDGGSDQGPHSGDKRCLSRL